jgi:hypothetical protein
MVHSVPHPKEDQSMDDAVKDAGMNYATIENMLVRLIGTGHIVTCVPDQTTLAVDPKLSMKAQKAMQTLKLTTGGALGYYANSFGKKAGLTPRDVELYSLRGMTLFTNNNLVSSESIFRALFNTAENEDNRSLIEMMEEVDVTVVSGPKNANMADINRLLVTIARHFKYLASQGESRRQKNMGPSSTTNNK